MGRILHFLLKAIFILCIQIILASEYCKCSEPLPSHQQCIFLGSDLYKYLVKNEHFKKGIKIKIDDFFGKLLESLLRYNKKKSIFKLDTTSEEIKKYKHKQASISDQELYENIALFTDRNTINSSRMKELYKGFRELNELNVKKNDEKYEELKKTIEELKNKLTISDEVCNKRNMQNNSETQKDIDNEDNSEDEGEDEKSIKKLDFNVDKEKSKYNKSHVEDENIEDIVSLQTKFFKKHLNTSFEDLRKTLIYIYKIIKNSKNNKIEFTFSNTNEILAFKNKVELISVILNKIIINVILTKNNLCLENYFNILQDNANLFNVMVKSINNYKKIDSLKFVMQEECDVIKESAEKLKLFIDLCVEIPKIESQYIKTFPEISLKMINATIAGYFIDLMDFFINSKNDVKFIDYINKNRNDIESFLTKLKEISETNSIKLFKKLEKDVEEFFKNNKEDCNIALMGLQLFSIPSELNSKSFYYLVADEYMINEVYFYDEYIIDDYQDEADYVIYNDWDGGYQDFYANSEFAYQENVEFYDPNQQFPEYDNGEEPLQDDNTLKNSGENYDDGNNSATQEQEDLNDGDSTKEEDELEEGEDAEDANQQESEDAEDSEDANQGDGEDAEDIEDTDQDDAEDIEDTSQEDAEDINQEDQMEDSDDQQQAEDDGQQNEDIGDEPEDTNQEDQMEDSDDQQQAEDDGQQNEDIGSEPEDANQEDQIEGSDDQQQVEDDGSPSEDVGGGAPEDSAQGGQESENSSEGEQENVSPDQGNIHKSNDSDEDNQNNHNNVKNKNDDTAQDSDEKSNRTQYNKVNTQEEDNKSDSDAGNEESQNLETNNVASTHSQNNKNDFEQNFAENKNHNIRTSSDYESDEQEEKENPAHKKYFNSIFHKNVENFTHKDLLRTVNYFAKKHRKNNIKNKLSTFCDKQRIYSWEF